MAYSDTLSYQQQNTFIEGVHFVKLQDIMHNRDSVNLGSEEAFPPIQRENNHPSQPSIFHFRGS